MVARPVRAVRVERGRVVVVPAVLEADGLARVDVPDVDARDGLGRGRVEVELLDPAEGIAPGQAVVVYDGSRVVGSATISATARSQALA